MKGHKQTLRERFPYRWRVKTRLPDRFGQRCAVTARGRMNSARVEFEDGFTVITSRNYLVKRHDWEWAPPVERKARP